MSLELRAHQECKNWPVGRGRSSQFVAILPLGRIKRKNAEYNNVEPTMSVAVLFSNALLNHLVEYETYSA